MKNELYYQKLKLYKTIESFIKTLDYPLTFSNDISFYNHNKDYNCYAYALGLRIIDDYPFLADNGLSIYNPGTISSLKRTEYDETNLIDALLADCDLLGIECRETNVDSKIDKGMAKIAVYIESDDTYQDRDFHFARLNKNGIWSNMEGSGGPVFCLGRGRENVCNIYGYDFLGAYTLRKKR